MLYGARIVAFLSMQFLHKGVPQLVLEAEQRTPKLSEPVLAEHQNLGGVLLSLLSRPNICSKEYIIRQIVMTRSFLEQNVNPKLALGVLGANICTK